MIQDFDFWLNHVDPDDQNPKLLAERFLKGVNELGIDVYRSSLWLPTSHPELWGTQVVWQRGKETEVFKRDHSITRTPTYLGTPGEAVHQSRKAMDWRLDVPVNQIPFDLLKELHNEGARHYLIVPFYTAGTKEQPWITFATKRENGFSRLELNTLIQMCQPLGWKVHVTIARIASQSLLAVYLGQNAARRVLDGQFKRGSGETLQAVIFFCDLRNFTQMSAELPNSELVKILDRYFELIAAPIEEAGGEILKFIGDAILAIFPLDEGISACSQALGAARKGLNALMDEQFHDSIELSAGIALHLGEVMYGNIGGSSRLDFTVIGNAVNQASRMEALCKELSPLLISQELAIKLNSEALTDLGQHLLRGIPEPVRLFSTQELTRNKN